MNGLFSGYLRAGLLPAILLSMSSGAWALGDQWYIGLGGGASILDPTTEDPTLEIEENIGTAGTLFLGADLDEASSVQVQLHALGDAELSNGEQASYYAGDASVLYRFVDSRDFAPRGTVFGASLYGRFGLGFLERDSTDDLDRDAPIFFGAGAGVELYLTRNLALRAEGLYLERDASTFGLSLVGRFGGRRLRIARPALPPSRTFPAPVASNTAPPTTSSPAAAPNTATPSPTFRESAEPVIDNTRETDALSTDTDSPAESSLPETYVPPSVRNQGGIAPVQPGTAGVPALPTGQSATEPDGTPGPTADAPEAADELLSPSVGILETTDAAQIPSGPTRNEPSDLNRDIDGDGVDNEFDECPDSAAGFPVLGNGCPLLEGVLSGIQFADNTADLLPGSTDQLDYLVEALKEYPEARIELKAHADNSGDERQQSILTRARLKKVGTYLVLEGGIRARRLLLRSFGSSEPLADNSTEAGRRENNRIEIAEYRN